MNKIFYKKNLSCNYFNFKNTSNILKNINLLYFINLSYNKFLKFYLNEILKTIFPIYFHGSNHILEFLTYKILPPKKNHFYCISKGLTYSISIKIILNLYNFKTGKNLNIEKNKIRTDEIFIPNIPLITDNSTFIIDGIEKTIVSKLVRSPGLYFYKELKGLKENFIIKIVPDKGCEIDFYLNFNNLLYLKFKEKKLFIIDILKSYGLKNEEIIKEFYNFFIILFFKDDFSLKLKFDEDIFLNLKIPYDILDNSKNIILNKNEIIDLNVIEKIKNLNIEYIDIDKDFLLNKYVCENIYNNKGEEISRIFDIINDDLLNNLFINNINNIKVIVFATIPHSSIFMSLVENKNDNFKSLKILNNFLNFLNFNIFNFNILNFNSNNNKNIFHIKNICRKKINIFFKKNYTSDLLTIKDIINIVKILISFKDGLYEKTNLFDIRNLNLYLSGEMIGEIFSNFFLNLKRRIGENFFLFQGYSLNKFFRIADLVSELKNFFSTSRYCQYLDQVNLLSELSHKRKITFLGVIGISKKYSGFDSRDLNASHYSKICPIETPEGINIGLVNSLAFLCSVDKYNFLVSPYYKVLNGKIFKKWIYLSVDEEFKSFISEPTAAFNDFKDIKHLLSKYGDQLLITDINSINYVNILSYQMLSISTTLIPFLENNDSNRALMASNMLRQALPCLFPSKPLISTGLENIIGLNSDNVLICKNKGVLHYKDSSLMMLKNFFNKNNYYYYNYDIYFILKYMSTNQKTNKSQRFLDNKKKEIFYPGDIVADGACTEDGELSMGQNMLTAFMCWEGYNFEDSIIISEKVIIDEKYVSLEIIQIDVNIFKISNKCEIITKEILKDKYGENNLDNRGIIIIGKKVYGGDILVGKICPIIEDFEEVDPKQRLIYSIFSSKSEFNFKDTSFYLPYNFSSGIVSAIDIYFSDNNLKFKKEDKDLLKSQMPLILKNKEKRYLFLKEKIRIMLIDFLIGKECVTINNIVKADYEFLKNKSFEEILDVRLAIFRHYNVFKKIKKKIKFFLKIYKFIFKNIKEFYSKKMVSNVDKIIRISIISKKNIQVGDKMSGRYGNKGVVSKILPINEMPYMFNGKSIDIILNPLGVPSRMNVGQLLEIHIGFASMCFGLKFFDLLFKNNSIIKIKELLFKIYNKNEEINFIKKMDYKEIMDLVNYFKNGIYFSIPPFGSFKENDINNFLNFIFSDNFLYDLGVSKNKKQIQLYDGRDGRKFKEKTTIGLMYIFKLNHLAEDKVHSRSVGPYSMVTQQPLKGKSNKGGQRLGEMEVWALEAYGAFYSIQEMFTIKSDDISGRFEAYRNIVKSIHKFNFNIPETFFVMMKNIESMSLYIRFNNV